ncbi:TIGR03619 family F420-dependent LLM class oxidoreductase [Rhodococcus wratislaviensis]|uniref:Putative oxidoreductase n=1 Tax=Rhodococcus wratislaviensis NBRC 100605 TaxID=1219028 RepID=X0Q032_RHOWR|nr:TIGR03619 family F420-dependent LLM class oxidoreductase [Rhodococcus wratislaviensis]GAF49258.1 putative oxidoreductase [Rhodococcus wratislaviensis NBRC 100605]
MRLSVSIPLNITENVKDWRFVLDFARICDQVGVDRIVAPDHVVFGERLEAYANPQIGGIANGSQPTGSDGNYFEPMSLLAALCAVTENVRLGTNILLAALRRPMVLAKSAATIDVLSGGRLDLGVGVGWQQEEYEAAGLDFKQRGRLLDHTLEVCQRLWLETRANYDSPELSFADIHTMPKPMQDNGVPIWCGGRTNANVARRVARYGSGWITWDIGVDAMADSIDRMRELVVAAGGQDSPFPVQVGLFLDSDAKGRPNFAKTLETIPELAAAGVTDITLYRLRPPLSVDGTTDLLGNLVSDFRKAAGHDSVQDVLSSNPALSGPS